MAVRFRPFGILGSSLEVLVGAWIISGLVTDEHHSAGFTTIVFVLGAILIGDGCLGLIAAARSRGPTSPGAEGRHVVPAAD